MSELLDTINCPRCGLGIDVHVPSRHVEAREAEVGQWAATVDRVTRERDDEHLARVEAEAKVERLNAAWNECSADKHRLLKEVRALDAEVERLQAREQELETCIRELKAVDDALDFSDHIWAGKLQELYALAAAPDLLNALEQCAAVMKAEGKGDDDAEYTNALAAIKKARGES